jgi:hypothetical protein
VSSGPLLVKMAVTAGLVAALMLATFGYAMRTRVHAANAGKVLDRGL